MSTRNRLMFSVLALAAATHGMWCDVSVAEGLKNTDIAARLMAAYPEYVEGVEGDHLKFKDGTQLPLGDGKTRPFDVWLAHPDIRDMFLYPYPEGAGATPPTRNFDPGRARNEDFFLKIYGDCGEPGFAASLTTIRWLRRKSGQRITVSQRNGVAEHLQAVSDELDALPQTFDAYLIPSAGGYQCRTIAGTTRRSGHGYGIAIDIATKHSHYWRWQKGGASGDPVYKNEIPLVIVGIFEKHGFIWGGRWYHYDTMHFEYRPELLGGGR